VFFLNLYVAIFQGSILLPLLVCMNGIRGRTLLLYKLTSISKKVVYVSLNSEECSLHKVKQVVTNSGVECVDA
jgi:hypothetical protein